MDFNADLDGTQSLFFLCASFQLAREAGVKHTPSLARCVFVIMALPTPTASPLRCASPTSALVEGFPSVAQRLAVYLILGDE